MLKEEKDSKETENKPENENQKESTQKILTDNIISGLPKNVLMNDDINKEVDSEQKEETEKTKNKSIKPNDENNFISSSIEKLQKGDEMEIMNELKILCEKLSLSRNEIWDNTNMPKLLEVLCNNLEKINLPKLIIYTLKCIYYILDINSSLISVLKRVNAIPKIILIINSLKDTECLDLVVSLLEKISYNHSFLLLENNAFPSLINIINNLGFPQRKSIMKTCLNISANTITYKQFDHYIKPAMEKLCHLTKFDQDNSYVNKKAIFVYYNIILALNKGYHFNDNPELENEISKYNFMDHFCEILKKYFIENNKIALDEIKKIFKIINIIFQVSKKETSKLLSLNYLGLVVEILHNEFNNIRKTQNKTITTSTPNKSINSSNNKEDLNPAKSNSSFLAELFSSLSALFPEKKDNNNIGDLTENKNYKKIDENILRKNNSKYYNYLCNNIIKPLVNNILNKSTYSTLNNLVKLILVFSKTASKEDIQNYINSNQLALIISNLLDTKYEPYIFNLISLLEILMSKVPEHFIQSFINEGIIENFKNYEMKKKLKNTKNFNNKDKDNDSFSDILEKDYNIKEYSDEDSYEKNDEDNQNDENDNNFHDNEKRKESGKENKAISLDLNSIKDKKDKTEEENKEESEKEDKEINDKKHLREIKLEEKPKDIVVPKSYSEKQKTINDSLYGTKKLKNQKMELNNQGMKISLEERIKELLDKYFTEDKIKSYLEIIKYNELNKIREDKEDIKQNEIKEEIVEEGEKVYISEYLENHKIDEYEQIPYYIDEKEDDSNLIKECQKIINKYDIDLPIIVIEDEFYDNFCDFTDNYIKYEEYKVIYLLKDKLIINKTKIKNYNILHKEINNEIINNKFFAEAISISNIILYNKNDLDEIIKGIKIMSNNFKNDFLKEIQNWVRTVFNIMSEYILFKLKDNPIYYCCNICKKPILYVESINLINNINNNIKNENRPEIIEKKKEIKIQKEKKIMNKIIHNEKEKTEYKNSFMIANNILNLMDFKKGKNGKSQKNIANPPKNTKNNTGNLLDEKNILYYDENKYADCELFEREISGCFLFVSEIKSLELVMNYLKSQNCQKKFILLVAGQYSEKTLDYLNNNNFLNLFYSCCIYTQNNKYNFLQNKYSLIKGFFGSKKEINNYIINCPNLGIFHSVKLLNFKKYSDRYFSFHQIISSQYGTLTGNLYNSAVSILDDYLTSVKCSNKNTLMNALKVFGKGESNSQLIIKGYTGNDYYRDFNRWLYEYDSLAYEKTSFFLSGLIYSLNLYGKQQNTWENKEITLYRGMRLSYIDVLPYEKNLGNIISFPNFTSSSIELSVAKNFSDRNSSVQSRKSSNIFSVILTIKNNYKSGWIPIAINVRSISQYPSEEERIFQPFTFYKVTKVDINIDNYTADIDLETIGRKTILEEQLKIGGKLRYNLNEGIMEKI